VPHAEELAIAVDLARSSDYIENTEFEMIVKNRCIKVHLGGLMAHRTGFLVGLFAPLVPVATSAGDESQTMIGPEIGPEIDLMNATREEPFAGRRDGFK